MERREKMSTTIRPEISKRNKYWIERHRYYELKHFCLQYKTWKKIYADLDGLKAVNQAIKTNLNMFSKPTENCALIRSFYSERMNMVENAAKEADFFLSNYILKGVTEGYSYNYLKSRLNMPCSRDTYYDRYRRFFWILSKDRQ